ncbi:MAG: hypothetical protein AB7S92_12805 [Parvibaculaceae bacterium]
MALWTVTDIEPAGDADGRRTVRIGLSDGSALVSREIGPREAADLGKRIGMLLEGNPDATTVEVEISGEVYEIDAGSATSLLARLGADPPRKFALDRRAFVAIIAIGVMLALLAGWAATYWVLTRSIQAANLELAGQILQNPRTDRRFLNWAVDLLARDAAVAVPPERRRQMVQLLAANPETSYETIVEIYGAEFPEFKLLAVRRKAFDSPVAEEAAGPGDTSDGGSGPGTQKTDGEADVSRSSGKEFIDRIPERQDESPSGQAVPPDQLKGSAQTVYPKMPGQAVSK